MTVKIVTRAPEGLVNAEAMKPDKRSSLIKMIHEELDMYFVKNTLQNKAADDYVLEYLEYVKEDGYIAEFLYDRTNKTELLIQIKLHEDDSGYIQINVLE